MSANSNLIFLCFLVNNWGMFHLFIHQISIQMKCSKNCEVRHAWINLCIDFFDRNGFIIRQFMYHIYFPKRKRFRPTLYFPFSIIAFFYKKLCTTCLLLFILPKIAEIVILAFFKSQNLAFLNITWCFYLPILRYKKYNLEKRKYLHVLIKFVVRPENNNSRGTSKIV